MQLHSDSEIIRVMGGSTAFARYLGYDIPDGTRRVNNWRLRGIPSHVRVAKDTGPLIRRAERIAAKVSIYEPGSSDK